jgi:DNA mismatch repair protein MutS2
VDRARKSAFVRIGVLGMKARFSELLDDGKGQKGAKAAKAKPSGGRGRGQGSSDDSFGAKVRSEDLIRTSDNSLNLVGQRVDEALAVLDRRLDKAALADQEYLFVIHGVGSGQLRKALRRHLDESDYASSWEPAPDGGGSDAVTLVHL